MKRYSLLLSLWTALGFALVGCGTTEDDADPRSTEQTPGQGQPEVGNPETTPDEQGAGSGEVVALGKSCWATCTVQNVDPNVWCPSTISGYGSTSFLGGCTKACNKADGDAASKLPPGCVIYSCSHSGC